MTRSKRTFVLVTMAAALVVALAYPNSADARHRRRCRSSCQSCCQTAQPCNSCHTEAAPAAAPATPAAEPAAPAPAPAPATTQAPSAERRFSYEPAQTTYQPTYRSNSSRRASAPLYSLPKTDPGKYNVR